MTENKTKQNKNHIIFLDYLDKFPIFGNLPNFEPLDFCSDISLYLKHFQNFSFPKFGFESRIHYLLTLWSWTSHLNSLCSVIPVGLEGNNSTPFINMKKLDVLCVKHLTQWQEQRSCLVHGSCYHCETSNNLPSIFLIQSWQELCEEGRADIMPNSEKERNCPRD